MLHILLIDDEQTVLDGICYLLEKWYSGFQVVDTANSAVSGLQILGERAGEINLVITDVRMPQMSGIEVVKVVRKKYPHIQVIVLSAYSDYDYVREALQIGAFDYLLKPCPKKAFIATLDKVREKIREQEGVTKQEKQVRLLEKEILQEGQQGSLFPPEARVQMVLVSSAGAAEGAREGFLRQLEAGQTPGSYLAMTMQGNDILVLGQPVEGGALSRLLAGYAGQRLYAAVKEFPYSAGNLARCYHSCQRMLEAAVFNNLATVMDSAAWRACKGVLPPLESLLEDYRQFLVTGDAGRLKRRLHRNVAAAMESPCLDPTRLKEQLFRELLAIEELLLHHQSSMEEVLGRPVDFLYELERLSEKPSLMNWYRNICEAITDHNGNGGKPPSYIGDAVAFIEANYMRGLELREVADSVYLNEWYFSTQFKKYMGASFSEYLNQVRIRCAKELLREKDLKIYRIAEMVGFQNQAYFSLIFRRMENISPKQYQAGLAKKHSPRSQ